MTDADAEAATHAAVHPLAVVDPRARLHPSVRVGPFAVVGPEIVAAPGVVIAPHAVLDGPVELGHDVHIAPFACVGTPPQSRHDDGRSAGVRIGARSVVREYASINRGTGAAAADHDGWTLLGQDVLVMANCHVAHDCRIGDRAVLANGAMLAGHVELEHDVTLGGRVAIQQHARIGRFAFLAGGAMVERDVPPYCRVAGDRARLAGLNLVGLRRASLAATSIAALRLAYRALFRTRLPLAEAVDALAAEPLAADAHVRALLDFVARSPRGICR